MKQLRGGVQDSWRRAANDWIAREPQYPSDCERVISRIHEESGLKLTSAELARFLNGEALEQIERARDDHWTRPFVTLCRKHDSLLIGVVISLLVVGAMSYFIAKENRQLAETHLMQQEEKDRQWAEIRKEAEAQLASLQALSREGKTTANLRMRESRIQEYVRVTIWNDSPHDVAKVTLELVDMKRRKKMQNERYNGIPIADMGEKMNPKWLRETGHYARMSELRTETQYVVQLYGPIRSGKYFQKEILLPAALQATEAISATITDASGIDGVQWSTPSREYMVKLSIH